MITRNNLYGMGCPVTVFGLPENFPEPSTDRGRRRLAKLTPQSQEQRRKIWGKARSTRQSKKQQELAQRGLTR